MSISVPFEELSLPHIRLTISRRNNSALDTLYVPELKPEQTIYYTLPRPMSSTKHIQAYALKKSDNLNI